MEDYKLQEQKETFNSLAANDTNFDFHAEATKICLDLIEEYKKIDESNEYDSIQALEPIKEFISQNYTLIDPAIFLQTGFLDHIISYFISPSLIIPKKLSIPIIELLTNYQDIGEYLFNCNFDIMTLIARFISEEPNVNISARYFNILIHLLPSFFKFGHESSELFIDLISDSSAHLSVVKFFCHLISYSDIPTPKIYIKILYDKLEKISENSEIDEDVLHYIFICFLYLSKCDISNNRFILENIKHYSDIPIFEYVMKYFDYDVHINMKKVMDPLFGYIQSIFNHRSVEKINYEVYLFQFITNGFDFFMFIFQNSIDSSIRTKALECINDAIHLDSLKDFVQINDFLLNKDLFQLFVGLLKEGTTLERDMAFQIIMKKVEKIRKDSIEFIYDLDFLEEIRDMICIEPAKSVLFFIIILYHMDEINRGKEAALRITQLNVFDEVNHYIESELLSKLENEEEKINECTTMLKKLLDQILGVEG